MSDLSSNPTLADNLASVLKAAPSLGESPGTAVAAASAPAGDPTGTAQALGRAAYGANATEAAQTAAKPAGHPGVLGEVFGFMGHAVTAGMHDVATAPADIGQSVMNGLNSAGNLLNKGLAQVQHEYRYLHDIEARHGMVAALGEGLGIAAGAGIGTLVEPGEGTVLGAEAAARVEGALTFKDSWANTADGAKYRDPHTSQPVSIGRDIASFITGSRKGVDYNTISGVVDGLFDITADPLAQTGLAVGAARNLGVEAGGKGLTGPLKNLWGGLGVRAGELSGEDVERAYNQYPSVRRAFGQIADLSPGDITARYPQLGPVADRLGRAQTPEEVGQVFKELFRAGELITTDRLPTMSFTRLPFNSARIALGNAPETLPQKVLDVTGSETAANAAYRVGAGLGRGSRALSRLSNVYNPDEFKYSNNEFSPDDNYGLRGVYDMLRLGETPQVASDVVTELANTAEAGRRRTIYKNAVMNMLFARAHIDPEHFGEFADATTKSQIKQKLDELTGGALPTTAGHYGHDITGRDISKVTTGESEHTAAILPNQTGNFRLPSAREVRDAAKWLQGSKDYFGQLDDFAYEHVTTNLFKRLVLLTGSYAQHITAAELVPIGLRVGFTNLIRSGVQMNRALGHMTDEEVETHVGAIRGMVYKLLRMDRGEMPSNEDVQLASRYVHLLQGWTSPTAASAGENVSSEVKQIERFENTYRKAIFNSPKQYRSSKDFGETGRSEEHFADDWQSVLHEMSRSDGNEVARLGARELLNGARSGLGVQEATGRTAGAIAEWLRAKGPEWLSHYERSTANSSVDSLNIGMDPIDDWARVMTEHIKGATFAPDGSPHINLLDHVANGDVIPTKELDAIPLDKRPLTVKGRTMVTNGANPIARFANWGFGKVLNPFVQSLSREPLAFQEFKQQWKLVEPAVKDGTMTEDEAMVTAMHRTATRSVRFIHNLHDRTQWTDTMRNFAPFYFAQEQAYRRMGRMLAENPGAFRRYQMMITGLQNFATRQTNANGQEYVVVPGTGFLTQGVISALHALHAPVELATPVGMGWNVTSANVVFPMSETVRPGVGPVYAIPAQAISRVFSMFGGQSPFTADVAGIASEVSGSIQANEPMWQQLIPNTILQRLTTAAIAAEQAHNGKFSGSTSFDSTFIGTLQALDFEGKLPPESAGPVVMQNFLNRVKNQTVVLMVMKAVVGAVTPVSPELQVKDLNLPSQLTADISKTGSVIAGTQEFLKKNPDATPWTVFRSTSPTGAPLTSSQEAENWYEAHSNLFQDPRYSMAAAYFLPQLSDTKYNSTVYNEQIAQGLREKRAPSDMLNQLYYMAGENVYAQSYQNYLNASKHESGQALSTLYNNFQTWTNNFSASHPIWAEIHGAADARNNRIQAIKGMKSMIQNNAAPPGEMTDGIKTLLSSYDAYVNAVNIGKQDNYSHYENVQLDDNWANYLNQTAEQYPYLSTVISSVFLYAPKTGTGS